MITLFGIGAGILYIVGLLFGWDYVEASVHICVEWVPWTCFLSTLIPLIYASIKLKNPRPIVIMVVLYCLITSIIYYFIAGALADFWTDPIYDSVKEAPLTHDSYLFVFNRVKTALENIAGKENYYTTNVIIYMIIFPAIVIWNAIIKTKFIKKIHVL